MMRNILTHANHEWWREQRSTCARSLDPKNQDRMKQEESWSGAYELGQSDGEMELLSKMVGKSSKIGKSLVKTAEELCGLRCVSCLIEGTNLAILVRR